MKKQDSGFGIVELLLTLSIIGLIIVIGWFVYNQQNSKSDNNQLSVAQQDNKTSIGNGDVPEDWEKYTNEIYGFSFNYPKDWKLEELNSNPDSSEIRELFSVTVRHPSETLDWMEIMVLDMKYDEMLTNEEIISWNIFDTTNGDQEDITLNGYKGHQYNFYDPPGNFNAFFEVNDKLILFVDDISDGSSSENDSLKIYKSFSIN